MFGFNRPPIKADGFQYCELEICYVDDVLSVSWDSLSTRHGLQAVFKLNGNKIEEPSMYHGAQLGQIKIDGTSCWTISAEKYELAAIKNFEEALPKKGLLLPTKCCTPLLTDYQPELDTSAKLSANGVHQYYKELIGVLRWAVELGRVGIWLETALLSTHLAMPGIGHLNYQACRMLGCLKLYPKRKLTFDAKHPKISERMFSNMTGTICIVVLKSQYQETCLHLAETACPHIALWTLVMEVIV